MEKKYKNYSVEINVPWISCLVILFWGGERGQKMGTQGSYAVPLRECCMRCECGLIRKLRNPSTICES